MTTKGFSMTRFGKIGLNDERCFIFSVEYEDEPSAIYLGGCGEYDSYIDFISGLEGSPLGDVCRNTSWSLFQAWFNAVHDPEPDSPWEKIVHITVPNSWTKDEATGISIDMIREQAWFYIGEYLRYSTLPGRSYAGGQQLIASMLYPFIEYQK